MTDASSDAASESRVWFITGCSTGFGRALAEAVLERGDRLIATARRPEQIDDLQCGWPEQARTVRLDVTQPDTVQAVVDYAVEEFGRIDVLVNNAGYGSMGAIEEVSAKEARHQFEVNVFGALHVLRAALPSMRETRSGHILNISSMGGVVGAAGFGIYNGSKFALEGISEALAQEIAPFGIRVTIVEPGAFRTNWAGRSMTKAPEISDYSDGPVKSTRERIASIDGGQPGDPERAAQAMIAVVDSGEPPLRLPLGADALERIRAKLKTVDRELDTWETLALETSH